MLNMFGSLEDGEKVAIWGISSNPKTRTTSTGKTLTTLSVQIGKEGDDKVFVTVQAWEKLAKQFASLVDKRDYLFVVGTAHYDSYWSEKNQKETYYISAEYMANQVFIGGEAGMSHGMDDDEFMNLP